MSEQSQDRVEVNLIIPTYNRKDSLLRTLGSLNRQTCTIEQIEVIAVDNSRSSGTDNAAGGRSKDDSNVLSPSAAMSSSI